MNYAKPDGRKPTLAEKKHYLEMVAEMRDLQAVLQEHWLSLSVPVDWNGLDDSDPIRPKQERVTLRLDKNVVAWYRKLGHQWQHRVNQVLRIYMEGVMSGMVQTRHYEQPVVGVIPFGEEEVEMPENPELPDYL